MRFQAIQSLLHNEIDEFSSKNDHQKKDLNQIPKQIECNKGFSMCGVQVINNKNSITNIKDIYSLIRDHDPMKISLIKQTIKEEMVTPKTKQNHDYNTEQNIDLIKQNLLEQIPDYRRKGSLVLSDNRDKEFLYVNPSSGKIYRSYDEKGNRYLRSDILYKSISRDMRKYFSKDFNAVTGFILIKNRQEKQFFIRQIAVYLKYRFPELCTKFQDQEWQMNDEKQLIPNDLMFFFGCLIYPKEMYKSLHNDYDQNEEINPKQQSQDCKIKMSMISDSKMKMLHESLYSFSLEKLYDLINTELYAYFFCYYFSKQVLTTDYIENKIYNLDDSVGSHYPAFVIAYNLLLQLSQLTLISAIKKIKENPKNIQYKVQMKNYIQLKTKPMILFKHVPNSNKKFDQSKSKSKQRKNMTKRFSGTNIDILENKICKQKKFNLYV
ncbi:UNKNOWN [Stylonychia lemnae]|uniref:Uncharacterized protein n=1 Tax=Stylonychia lemnae TaxID=5949 RepID=A0A078AM01_STYLE|nr:UNKNOWN [Stylonychia lemnae]|eukprot:CDW82891.1 UNKNOWN [Stylonychia lemnae]